MMIWLASFAAMYAKAKQPFSFTSAWPVWAVMALRMIGIAPAAAIVTFWHHLLRGSPRPHSRADSPKHYQVIICLVDERSIRSWPLAIRRLSYIVCSSFFNESLQRLLGSICSSIQFFIFLSLHGSFSSVVLSQHLRPFPLRLAGPCAGGFRPFFF